MNNLSEFVSRLKAWQVFLILIVPMVVYQAHLISTLTDQLSVSGPQVEELWNGLLQKVVIGSGLMLVLMLGWQLSIGFAANRRIEASLRPGGRLAIGASLCAIGYVFSIPFLWPSPAAGGLDGTVGMSTGLIFPLHIITMIGLFYVPVFTAKNVVMAETQAQAKFGDYAPTFGLLWFFPIGVWFVQPRVNRLVERSS